MQFSFVHTAEFTSRFKRFRLGDDDLQKLESELGENPLAGDVIRGSGGVRKIRFAPAGRGKSGAYRVAYAFIRLADTIYLISIFAKKDQANFTAAQIAQMRVELDAIQKFHRKE